ncbi:MAG: hypothetical protein QM767_10305 [Anaeromyxobacter sp.]
MEHLDGEQLLVEARVLLQREAAGRMDAVDAARPAIEHLPCPELLGPDLGEPLGLVGRGDVLAEERHQRSLAAPLLVAHGQVRVEVVVVGQPHAGGLRLGGEAEGAEAFDAVGLAAGAGDEAVGARRPLAVVLRRVHDHQLLVGVGLLEVVVDALPLHPPREEVEVALAVLAHVLERAVTLSRSTGQGQPVVVGGPASLAQHLIDDRRDGVPHEDAAVPVLGEPPEPGHEDGAAQLVVGPGVQQLDGREESRGWRPGAPRADR